MSTSDNSLDLYFDNLKQWLTANVDGFGELQTIDKFKGGQSNPTYKLTSTAGTYVLRAKPPGALLKSAHQVDREYRVMAALADSKVAVPQMLALAEEDNSPIGRMFFVMEMLEGSIYWDPALAELGSGAAANEKRGRIYDAMNQTLAQLHEIDVAASGLSDFGVAGNYFERQFSRWRKQYEASEIDPIADMHTLRDWLSDHMPKDDGQVCLVHGDYRLDNLVFDASSDNIVGVLDWELSTLGHPLSDLAYQCMQWRLPHQGGFRGLGGIDRTAIGLPDEAAYVADYCKRRNIAPIENWKFYLAFSFFRLAGILQGVYKRSLDGNASNPERAKQYGAAVPILAAMSVQMIENET